MVPHLISAQSISVTGVTTTPVCAGSDVTVTFQVTNGNGVYFTNATTYQAYLSDASGNNFTISGGTFTAPGAYNSTNGATVSGLTTTFTIPVGKTSGSGYKISIGSTASPGPIFDASNGAGASTGFIINELLTPSVSISDPGAVCAGASVTYIATPVNGGSNPIYQWSVDGVNKGTNSATFTPPSPLANNHQVKVVMTSDYACLTTKTVSSTYTAVVNPIPTANALADQTVCDNSSTAVVNFSGAVSGTEYDWTNDNPSIGLAASGTGNIGSFVVLNSSSVPKVATITVTPAYSNGGTICTGTATTFTITVNPTPTASVTNNNQTICSGSAISTMVITGNVSGATYSWTRDNTAGVTGIAASGSGNISGSLTNTTNSPITVTFTITPTASSCSGTPVTATVLVNPTPTASVTNNNQTICSGSAISTMVITGNVSGATYSWTRDNTAGVTGIAASGSGNISGSLTNTTNSPITVTFTITPTTSSCSGTPVTATVLVNPTPTASVTNNNQTICSGSAISTMVITGNVSGATYSWTRDNTAGVTGIAASGSGNISGSLTNTTNSPITVTFTITPTASSCSGTPVTATVLVNPTPTASVTNNNQTICSGSAISTMVITGNVSGATYSWTRDNTAGVTGIAASGSGNISGSLTNTTNSPITVTFTITPTASSCSGTPVTATVLVNPTPTASVTNNNQTICSGSAISTMVITGNVSGATYSWTRDNTAGVTGIAASGSGNISGSLTNTTNSPITVTFTITPTTSSCSGTPVTATVLVNPTPTASVTNNNQTICSGSAISTMVITGNVSGATYSWTRDNTAGVTGIAASGSGNISGSLTNTTNSPITVTFTITPTTSSCSGTPVTATVLVNPILIPAVSIASTSANICSNGTATFTATPTNGGLPANYQWQLNGSNVGTNSSSYTATGLAAGNYTVKVIMTSTATCANPGSVTASTSLHVYSGGPSGWNGGTTIISSSQSICPPATVTLSVSATASNVQYYKWTLPTGWTITSGDSTAEITVAIDASSPQGQINASQLHVLAVNPCGTAGADPGNGNSAIKVSSFLGVTTSPTSSVCSNGIITLSGTLTGSTVSGNWSATNGSISNQSTSGSTVTATFTPNILSGTASAVITSNPGTGGRNGTCNTSATATVSIAVNKVVSITAQPATTQTLCSGSNASFSVTATGDGLNYQWYKGTSAISGATSATYTINNISTSDAGTYHVVVSGTAPCVAVTSNNSVLTVNQVVSITAQPATTQTLCSGSNASFSVTATGDGLNYQWYKGTSAISGATSATYTINNISTSDAGTYHVVVSGTAPCVAVTSNNSVLTVNQVVSITTQPATTQTLCSGSNASFSVTATGDGLNYQWYKGTSAISGATSATYTINNISTSDAGTYHVVVSGTAPCVAVTSNNSVLTVNQVVSITAQPATTQTLCSGSNASFSVTATGDGLNYQWYKGTSAISGATSATYTINNISTSDAGTYHVVVSGTAPCVAVTSNNSVLTVNQVVSITAQPATTQTLCSGSNASFSVTATGDGLNYQWYKGTSAISGATSATYTINNISTSDAGTYHVVVSGTAPCVAVTSNNSVLTVNQVVSITAQPATTQTLCSGSNASFSVTATGDGLNYQWYKGTSAISGATSATYTINNISTSDAGTYHVVVSGTAPCVAVTSNNSVLTVNQVVSITAQPATTQTLCSGSNASFSVTATGDGLNYQWYKGTSAISGATSATYTINNISTSDAGTYHVVVSGTAPCVAVTSNNSVLTVNQPVSITSQPDPSQAVCLTFPVSFSVTATGTNPTYQWNLNGNPIAGATSSTYSISQAKAADAGSYTVDVIGTGGCTTVTSTAAELVVNQTITFSIQPTDVAICTGNDANFSVTAAGTITDYQWRKDGVPITDGGNIFGATSSSLTVTGASATDAGSYDVVVSGPAGQCSQAISNPATLTINTAPSITTQPVAPTATCSGSGTQTISVVATGTNVTYTWRKGGTALTDGGVVSGQGTNTLTLTNATTADAGSYDVVISGTCTPSVTSDAVAVTINTAPSITTQPVAPTATCSGSGTQTISVVATGTNVTYTWRKGGTALTNGGVVSGQGTNTLTLTNATTADAGSYDVVISGTCTPSVTSDAVAVTINTAPSITTQPVAPTATCSGSGTQTISVAATGTNVTYTWRKGGTALTNGGVVSGQGTNTLTLTNATTADAGSYDVVISGTCTPSVTSDAVAVTINTAPSITTQPVAPTATCSGSGTQTISVAATGTNVTYTWRKGGTALTNGGVVSGQGTNTLTLTNATTADAGSYDVVISGTCTPSVTSDAVAVTINTAPSITTQPVAPTATCSGSGTQTISVVATGTNVTYTWRKGGTALTNGGVVSGQGTNTLTLTNATTADAGSYDVVISGTCTPSVTSDAVAVTINTAPSITTQPVAPTATCSGSGTQTISVAATGTNVTYTWRKGGTALTNGGIVSGQGTNTLTLTNATTADAGSYDVVISGTCTPSVTSNAVAISVSPTSVGGTLSVDGATSPSNVKVLCTTPNDATINLGNNVGNVTGWEYSTNGGNTWTPVPGSNTGTSLSVSGITQATIYRADVVSGACAATTSDIAVVSVIPPYTPPSIHVTKSVVCLGQSTYLSAPDAGLPFSLGSGDGDFQNANPPGWRKDGKSKGDYLPSRGSDRGTDFSWLETTNTGGSVNNTIGGIDYSSPQPKFAMVAGDTNSILETPVFSLAAQSSASFDFIQSYNFLNGASGTIEISTDGGNSYSTLLASYTDQFGVTGNKGIMQSTSIDLTNYIGLSNLRIRFKYNGTDNSAWAIDGVNTPGDAINTNLTWGGTTLDVYSGTSVTATPQDRGINYFVDSTFVNGCYSGSDTIPITALIGANFTVDQEPKTSTVCVGDVATFQGTPTGDSLVFTWERSTDNGTTWTTVTNGGSYAIANTFDYVNAQNNESQLTINTSLSNLDDLYRLTANNPGCGAQTVPAPILMNYVWKGTNNIKWSDGTNWDAGTVPDDKCRNVYILGNRSNDPTIDYQAPGIINLIMQPAAKLTINSTGMLTVAGHIDVSVDPYSLYARYGSLNLNAPHGSPLNTSADQVIDPHTFYNNDLYNLNLDNSSRVIASSDSLNIYGTLSFGTPVAPWTFAGGGNKTFVTSNLLTLKSNIIRTANVADMNNGGSSDIGNKISGDVIVERFVNVGPHFRGWQFLSAPITPAGQTIKQSWMENGSTPTGYGTWITGPYAGVDYFTYTPSLKYYLPNVADTSGTPDSWLGVPNTANPISNPEGYMIFIRSDRGAPYPTPIVMRPTTLRAKGPLWQPNNPAPQSVVDAGLFQSVGNPYASAVDWSTMLGTNGFVNLEQSITIWDPNLGGVYGFGGYQTISSVDGYKTSIATAAYPNSPIKTVESGQAFFVRSTGASGSVNFNENNKVNSSRLVTRAATELNAERFYFRARLYSSSGSPLDGNSTVFSSDFSNKIDAYDSHKLSNSGPNFGLIRNGNVLAVEARNQVIETDTIHYDIWSMVKGNYQIRFGPENMGQVSVNAELIDNYLNSRTSILVNDTTRYDFEINGDVKSAANNRFIVVFKRINTPVRFVFVHAQQKNEDIEVSWEVTNEEMVSRYEIEESSDGQSFVKASQVNLDSKKAGQYNWLDQHIKEGLNYYRIKVINKDGSVAYSQTVNVNIGSFSPLISIYPNPITNGIIHIRFNNQPAGAYALRLMNQLGQVILAEKVIHAGGNSNYPIKWDYNLAHGLYQLEIIKPGGGIKIIKVIY